MIVVNTSPWIALSLCGQNELLQRFYGEVYVPEGVKEELLAGGEKTIGVVELSQYPWVRVDRVFDSKKVTLLHELDRGEAEVIILALEKGIGQVMIDEKVARLQARVLGLEVIGTLGLLLRAKRVGFIREIKPHILILAESGIWIGKDLIEGVLRAAGEDL